MTNELISVIMPNFNCAAFINTAIESVMIQTYQELELIIIDDASSDNSLDIINLNKLKDIRIRVFQNHENRGPGYCRNIGLLHSKGRYITFIDSDDIYPKYRLRMQLDFLKKSSHSSCFGDYLRFKKDKIYKKNFHVKTNWKFNDIVGNPCLSIGTVMVDKNQISEIPKFPENINKGEDYCFCLALFKIVPSAIYTPDIFLLYRQRSKSASKIGSAKDVYWVFNEYLEFSRIKSSLCFLKYIIHAVIKRIHMYIPIVSRNSKLSDSLNKI